MNRGEILSSFDKGETLERCVNAIIQGSRGSQVGEAVSVVRAAMSMTDTSGAGVRTTVHSVEDAGRLHVGSGYIDIVDPSKKRSRKRSRVSRTAETVTLALNDDVNRKLQSVANFVSISVILRAACSRPRVRRWLADYLESEPFAQSSKPHNSTRPLA